MDPSASTVAKSPGTEYRTPSISLKVLADLSLVLVVADGVAASEGEHADLARSRDHVLVRIGVEDTHVGARG